MRKIVFFDVHGDESGYFKRTFKNVFASEVVCTPEPLTEISAKKYPDMQIASVFVTSIVNAKAISRLPDLEFVAARSTGCDHIDLTAANKHHVLVSNVPEYGATTVAEYAIMLLLVLVKRLPESAKQLESKVIDYPEITGSDLAGKTIGIIGCGQIGRRVGRIASSLGMKVLGFDLEPKDDAAIEYTELDELLKNSDVVSLHIPGGDSNRHFIDEALIKKMKKGVILLNTARGDLIDTSALVEGLFSGHISAAGLDVIEGEHLLRFEEEISLLHPDSSRQDLLLSAEHDALLRMPNVILTPHNAFNSREALERIRHTTAENIKKYLMHEPRNLVK